MPDLGTAYFTFSFFASIGALWMMQATTQDAGFRGPLSRVKLSHRFALACVSIVLFWSATDTLYYETAPRPVDFLVQFVLIMVVALSAVRHIAAPIAQGRNPKGQFELRKS